MSRRDQITLSEAELQAFLEEQRVVICATNGKRGWPHLMPLWYVVRKHRIWAWTYAKSQKVRNLERDSRATLQIETGEQYHELRGVMMQARAVIHRDTDLVTEVGAELLTRYGTASTGSALLEMVQVQATKRVALEFVVQRTATWDHGKLAGVH